MKRVAILIPASPTPAFFSQISAVTLALRKLAWSRWRPSVHVFFGGESDSSSMEEWRPFLEDVCLNFVPPADFLVHRIWAQADGLFRYAPGNADVIVTLDADTLPVGSFEQLLDRVVDTNSVGGVVAHYPFPFWPGVEPEAAWNEVAAGLIESPLRFDHSYTLVDPNAPSEQRFTPFYVNFGAVFFPAPIFREFTDRYLRLRSKVVQRLPYPYFSGQIALALAISEMRVSTAALPFRFNFPNDAAAAERFPEELLDVAIFHYLRMDEFDRAKIFSDESHYVQFLKLRLTGVNQVFQNHVRRVIGENYPFRRVRLKARGGALSAGNPSRNPLNRECYEAAISEQIEAAGPMADRLVEEIQNAGDSLERAILETKRTILLSGLFDAEHYLKTYDDVRLSGVDPLDHYVRQGYREDRCPNPIFEPTYYRRCSMSGAEAHQNPLEHYILEGERNDRKVNFFFSPRTYLEINPNLLEFVDRPLFHYLKIGKPADLVTCCIGNVAVTGLPVAVRDPLAAFLRSGSVDMTELGHVKQSLAAWLGVENGFTVYKGLLSFPEHLEIYFRRLESQRSFAQKRAERFVETAPGGEKIVIEPPSIVGMGEVCELTTISRSSYVACLSNACVWGKSTFVGVDDVVLLDYEGDELEKMDTELEFDSAVFRGSNQAAWIVGTIEEASSIVLDEAFTLLSARSAVFGHWMWESLPKLIAAQLSNAMPPVPILVDDGMPKTHRQSLELLLQGGEQIIEIPTFASARVRKLWCAPTAHYAPVHVRPNEKAKWDYLIAPPERHAAIFDEMRRRVDRALPAASGPERLFFTRRNASHRRLVNHERIEALAEAHGFHVCNPAEADFSAQLDLVRNARFILAPEGSAAYLAIFAPAGAKLCLLSDPKTDGAAVWKGLLQGIGIDLVVLTGPAAGKPGEWVEWWTDFAIEEDRFQAFLDQWLNN